MASQVEGKMVKGRLTHSHTPCKPDRRHHVVEHDGEVDARHGRSGGLQPEHEVTVS